MTLAACASRTPAVADALDLSHYKLVFDEDFSQPSISAHGPGTRWIAHTPWHGDFGDAHFVDPRPGFPFDHDGKTFRIGMHRTADGRWESGLLASVDEKGHGFALQYGYFEIRAKLPKGPGVWPSFWLDSFVPAPLEDPSIEIDIFEHYGKFPGAFNTTVTSWPKAGHGDHSSKMYISKVAEGSLSSGFHRYGVMVTPEWCIFFLDGEEFWRTPTPPNHKHPLMLLADLGLGGGWPISEAPNPAYMSIDYIRAYVPTSCRPATEGLPAQAFPPDLKPCS